LYYLRAFVLVLNTISFSIPIVRHDLKDKPIQLPVNAYPPAGGRLLIAYFQVLGEPRCFMDILIGAYVVPKPCFSQEYLETEQGYYQDQVPH